MSLEKSSNLMAEFLSCYSKQSENGRYFSKSQVFMAYRGYLSRMTPHNFVSMDYENFSYEFEKEAERFQLNTKVAGTNKYYKLFLKPSKEESTINETKLTPETSPSDKDSEKVPLNDLNIYLCCKLCCGYLVDATTITECLHSFCKSCIVMHFQINKSCPICSTVVPTANPVSSLKSDSVLQDIVNSMLPGTVTNEAEKFNQFAEEMLQNESKALSTYIRMPRRYNLTTICLEWIGKDNCTLESEDLVYKFIRISDQATVAHIAQFILQKLEKTDKKSKPLVKCEVKSGGVVLPYIFTIEDIIKNELHFESKRGIPLFTFDLKPL